MELRERNHMGHCSESWNAFDEAMVLVMDGAEDIKANTRLCVQTHFTLEEQKRMNPQIIPVYTNPDAGMLNDGETPFAMFEVHDFEGEVMLSAQIDARGLYMFKYRPEGSATLIMDDAPCYCMSDSFPNSPVTIMKWALFTMALSYLLAYDCDELFDCFYMEGILQ